MRRLAPILLLAFAAVAIAEGPAFPRVPAGFDEGREAFMAELAEDPIPPGHLVPRLFEHADLPELAAFIHRHLSAAEKASLSESLKLSTPLARARDADAVLITLGELKPVAVSTAIGEMLVARGYSLTQVGAWLAARGFNFRVLQAALNGERIDCFIHRASLRAQADAGAHVLFRDGAWRFNSRDGRLEKGGHYDGVQLVEALLALGWKAPEFARAMGLKDTASLGANTLALIEWGDAPLLWADIELRAPESEFAARAFEYYRDRDAAPVLDVGLRRADSVKRWLRTGGPGVRGVYEGPWPTADGAPKPPVVTELLDAPLPVPVTSELKEHFAAAEQTLLLVVYADGSARALLRRPGRAPVVHGAGSPTGNQPSTDQCYEGRASVSGRNALLRLVYADEENSSPARFELVNLRLPAQGALLSADIDDGLELTPLLLRRTTRLTEAP